MANLLPKHYKKKIRREYHLRQFAVIGGLLIMVVASAAIALLPSYAQVSRGLSQVNNELRLLEDNATDKKIKQYIDLLKDVNTKVQLLAPPENELRTYVVLKSVLAEVPEGVSIKSITLGRNKQDVDDETVEAVSLVLAGVADTRETLTVFEQNIDGISFVESVNLPVSSLAARNNIEFSLQAEGVIK